MPNPHLYYPPEAVAPYCDDEQLANLIDANTRHLDASAAEMLGDLAKHHRRDWESPAFATFARRVLRMVAGHLRDRSDD